MTSNSETSTIRSERTGPGPKTSSTTKKAPLDEDQPILHCLPYNSVGLTRNARQALDVLFQDDHKPLIVFPPRKKTKSREKFQTTKYRGGKTIVYRNRWMHNALVILETDPDVVAMSPYPVKIRYIGADDDRNAVWKDHVPSLAVLRRDGSVTFLDFLHDYDAEAVLTRTEELALSLREDFGAAYEVMTATGILAQPRFYNANLIWAHKPSKGQIVVAGSLERDILRQPLPMSITEIADQLDTTVTVERFDDEPPGASRLLHHGVNLVFSTCLRLAAEAKIELDMSRPITSSTIVTKRI